MFSTPNSPPSPLGSDAPLAELLLADTAIRIELPPSLHQTAVDRYEAIRTHIEREDSPLFDRVKWFYPQGSMAIGATIKSKRRADGYDIDIVAELLLPSTTPPGDVLDLLFEAINGPKGSKYHGMVERQTRCVTVYYADGMHLDVTPSQLLNEDDPRRSHIFHAKSEEHLSKHFRVVMNSWAFCDWFNHRTPKNKLFEDAYARREREFRGLQFLADADVKPVPAHTSVQEGKSTTVVALQLLKRNRNIRYETRGDVRLPPSVMMASVAGSVSVPDASIAEALEVISGALLLELVRAEDQGLLVDIRNPRCDDDRFTDRWPENRGAQRQYISDLKIFRGQLQALVSPQLGFDAKRDLLIEMFGAGPAQAAVDAYAARLGDAVKVGQRINAPSGRVVPVVSGVSAPLIVTPARGHTFYGGRREDLP